MMLQLVTLPWSCGKLSEKGALGANFICQWVDKEITFSFDGWLVMQDENKSPSSAYDFIQLAQHAVAQARANLERARVLTEMGETYLERARLAERSAPNFADSPIPALKSPHARQ